MTALTTLPFRGATEKVEPLLKPTRGATFVLI